MDLGPVCEIIGKHDFQKSALIGILQDIQAVMHYLPQKALVQVSKSLDIPLTHIYEVATFYKAFSLEPRGKHTIKVCLGTACHVRGGPKILKEITQQLTIEPGQTTKDKKFSFQVVNCLGVCAIGPVMFVDGKFYGEMTPVKARRIIDKLSKGKGGVKS